MCGLTGVILQTKRRRKNENEEIGRIFTELLLLIFIRRAGRTPPVSR